MANYLASGRLADQEPVFHPTLPGSVSDDTPARPESAGGDRGETATGLTKTKNGGVGNPDDQLWGLPTIINSVSQPLERAGDSLGEPLGGVPLVVEARHPARICGAAHTVGNPPPVVGGEHHLLAAHRTAVLDAERGHHGSRAPLPEDEGTAYSHTTERLWVVGSGRSSDHSRKVSVALPSSSTIPTAVPPPNLEVPIVPPVEVQVGEIARFLGRIDAEEHPAGGTIRSGGLGECGTFHALAESRDS